MSDAEPLEPFMNHVFSESWREFSEEPALYILAGLVVIAGTIVSLGLLLAPLSVGMARLVAARRRGEAASVGDVLSHAEWGGGIVVGILIAVGVSIGLLFLVVPGLLFAFFSSLTLHAMALEDEGPIDAIKTSFSLVKDHAANLFVLSVVLTALASAGGAIMLGALLTTPFILIAYTVAYQRITLAGTAHFEPSAGSL